MFLTKEVSQTVTFQKDSLCFCQADCPQFKGVWKQVPSRNVTPRTELLPKPRTQRDGLIFQRLIPEWYLRMRAHLNLGLSPGPYGLNIKCIKALYLESRMPFLGNSPGSPSDFVGSTKQIGVSGLSLVFIIYQDLMVYSQPGGSCTACSGRLDPKDSASLVYRLGGWRHSRLSKKITTGGKDTASPVEGSGAQLYVSDLESSRKTLPCEKLTNSDFKIIDWDPFNDVK